MKLLLQEQTNTVPCFRVLLLGRQLVVFVKLLLPAPQQARILCILVKLLHVKAKRSTVPVSKAKEQAGVHSWYHRLTDHKHSDLCCWSQNVFSPLIFCLTLTFTSKLISGWGSTKVLFQRTWGYICSIWRRKPLSLPSTNIDEVKLFHH